jgi:hypothetical protein
MAFLETYGKEIVALLVPLVTWSLNTFFKAKAKLLLATPHTFTFLVQEPLRDQQGNVLRPTQTIQPNEYLGCEIFSINADLPNLLTVRSNQCVARTVNMYPQPVVANWQRRLGVVLVLGGL